jgi:hypothetical protein
MELFSSLPLSLSLKNNIVFFDSSPHSTAFSKHPRSFDSLSRSQQQATTTLKHTAHSYLFSHFYDGFSLLNKQEQCKEYSNHRNLPGALATSKGEDRIEASIPHQRIVTEFLFLNSVDSKNKH